MSPNKVFQPALALMRRFTLQRLLATLLLAASQTCFAESFPSSGAAKDFADKVMARVAAGDVEAGMKMMKPYTIIPAAEFDSMMGQVALQLPMITQRFGKSIGSEFIKQDKVGESVVRLLYLSKHEKHATRWFFYLYKTPQGWVINTFTFDDKIQELFPH